MLAECCVSTCEMRWYVFWLKIGWPYRMVKSVDCEETETNRIIDNMSCLLLML